MEPREKKILPIYSQLHNLFVLIKKDERNIFAAI